MTVPPRKDWPQPGPQSEGAALLTDVILATFRLNARLMEAAQDLAAHGGLTAAWWQVLGGVLDEPRSVADVGRIMGVSRQGVQRIADLLVERGLAEYRPNPAHRRAKLLACTRGRLLGDPADLRRPAPVRRQAQRERRPRRTPDDARHHADPDHQARRSLTVRLRP